MSYNIFEKITQLFKKNNTKNSKQKSDINNDIEEKKLLLSNNIYRTNSKPILEQKINKQEYSLKIRLLPSLYLFINLSLIFLLLFFKFNKNFISKNDLITKSFIVLPDFFDLYKVNNIIYHCFNIFLSILGLLICFSVYSLYYNQLASQNKNNLNYTYRLYLMLLFGLISNIFLLIISFTPRTNDLEFTDEFKLQTKIRLNQFLFIVHIFFSCLFCTFSICSLNISDFSTEVSRKKWLGFKLIVLIYMIIFSISYVIILLFKNKLADYQVNLETNYNHSLVIMPYIISILNSLFVFSFCYETRDARLYLGNMFEKEETNEKNTL